MADNNKVYELVTERIIAKLEQGQIPWFRDWETNRFSYNRFDKDGSYSMLNQIMLEGGEYASFKQWTEHGFKIQKGAKGEIVTFWKPWQKENKDYNGVKLGAEEWLKNARKGNISKDENGNAEYSMIPVLKYYYVFNNKYVTDKDGNAVKPVRDYANVRKHTENETIQIAEKVADNYTTSTNLKLFKEQSNSAYYSPSTDEVHVPLIEQFKSVNGYYQTLFHELTHSTGHGTRLNRAGVAGSNHRFGSMEYSKEELVAELGSNFILSRIGINTDNVLENSTAYIQGWLKALKDDVKMVVNAASKAQKAADYILGFTDIENIEVEDITKTEEKAEEKAETKEEVKKTTTKKTTKATAKKTTKTTKKPSTKKTTKKTTAKKTTKKAETKTETKAETKKTESVWTRARGTTKKLKTIAEYLKGLNDTIVIVKKETNDIVGTVAGATTENLNKVMKAYGNEYAFYLAYKKKVGNIVYTN